jgi:hypothetical protein
MVLIKTEQECEPRIADHWRWLHQIAVLSEKVNGRWRHRLIGGGAAWAEYLENVEARDGVR